MNKINLLKIIKLSLGSSLAIFIASLLKLEYSMVAGVIVLLTVKNTKKETLKGIIGKVYGFILCTIISYLCFNILGYHLTTFAIFIFIIISICFLLDIQDVIAMCVVISSHYFLQKDMSLGWILNETGIFIIGAGIGVVINMYMPTNIHKIYEGQKRLQEEVSTVLISIADVIVNSDNKDKYNNVFKAKDVAEIMFCSSRSVSGSMRKLVTDGFVDKAGTDPTVYSLTEKGETCSLEVKVDESENF